MINQYSDYYSQDPVDTVDVTFRIINPDPRR